MNVSRRARGFSLIEVMVVVSIIAIMMAMAVPSFVTSVRTSNERAVIQQMRQDFQWARGAAGAADASGLNSSLGLSGPPTITFTLNGDCSYTTGIATPTSALPTTDPTHSMTTSQVSKRAGNMTCTGLAGYPAGSAAVTLPVTFTFGTTGYINNSGMFQLVGPSGQIFDFEILMSGSIFRVPYDSSLNKVNAS